MTSTRSRSCRCGEPPRPSDAERAALALTDALFDGYVPDQVNATLGEHFDEKARVALTLTAAFYCAVPRLLDALRVPVEEHAPQRVDREDGNDGE
ncbi:MAG: hypothetical protein M3283_04400 [Actinomycetota bacterium]|nr:hypothetical protein [Actinomycetota bacterium]